MSILQQMLQPIWEISSEAIFITGDEPAPEDRRILYVNEAFTKMSGFSREQAIGQTPGMLHGPGSDPNVLGSSEEQLRTGKPHEYIQRHYRRDGSNDLCAVTRAALVDVDGSSRFLISMYKECPQNDSYAARGETVDRNSVPLTLPMPLLEFPYGDLPEHLPSHPELDALLALWTEIRDMRELPDREDFTLDIMTRWASHLSIALVLPDGRFQFRLFGTELANVYGHDLTGLFLDELTPNDLWSVVIQHYHGVVDTGMPSFAPISVSNGRWYTEVSRLLLPLSGAGGVNFIMGADYKRDLR